MKRTFVSSLRLLAQFPREPVSKDLIAARAQSSALRETINNTFDKARALADGVLFEFGPSRQQVLAFRDRLREWLPQLRTLFLIRIASLKYRFQLPGFELPEDIRRFQEEYDDSSARMLEDMADRIENNGTEPRLDRAGSFQPLDQSVGTRDAEGSEQPPASNLPSFHALIRGIDGLTTALGRQSLPLVISLKRHPLGPFGGPPRRSRHPWVIVVGHRRYLSR